MINLMKKQRKFLGLVIVALCALFFVSAGYPEQAYAASPKAKTKTVSFTDDSGSYLKLSYRSLRVYFRERPGAVFGG
ncbi:MAG: hypothetical protein IJW67_13610 [Blautia sp.]|nr:hypothetical protein [Blautia sp.]